MTELDGCFSAVKMTRGPRRGAGVVERAGLEIRCTACRTVGSNPTLSAIIDIKSLNIRKHFWTTAGGLTSVLTNRFALHTLGAVATLTTVNFGLRALRFNARFEWSERGYPPRRESPCDSLPRM
jgi:hypothetical protein